MNTTCAVCGETSTRLLALCPKCHRPRHSKCSNKKKKKKDAMCNLCRNEDQHVPLNKTANTTTQMSARTTLTRSLRGMPKATKIAAPHHRAPLGSTTPADKRSSHSSSTNTNASLPGTIIEPAGQVAGAPGAAKGITLGAITAERENSLRAEESATDDSASQETVLRTPNINTTSHNNSQTSTAPLNAVSATPTGKTVRKKKRYMRK